MPITGNLQYVPGFNANGIVDARGYLLVVQSATGLLFRVDAATGGVRGCGHGWDVTGQR